MKKTLQISTLFNATASSLHPLRTGLSACLLATVLITAPALSAVNEKSQEYYEEAQSYIIDGDLTAASIQLKNAIKADPSNVDARMQLATIHIRAGDGPSAEKEIRASLSRGYDKTKTLTPLGQALAIQGKWQAIIDEIEPKSASALERALLFTLRADAYIQLDDYAAAQQEVDKALALKPTIPEPYISEGTLKYRKGELQASEDALRKAIELGPENFLAFFYLGETVVRLQRYDEALTYYDKAVELNGNDSRVRIGRANLHIILKNNDLAELDAQAVLERNSNNPIAKYIQTVVLARRGQSQIALETLLSAQGQGIESYPPALFLFATLYYATDQKEIASSYVERFLAQSPGNTSGRLLTARIALDDGDTAKAIDLLEELDTELNDNYQVTLYLANAYSLAKRYNDAALLFDKASTLNPEDDVVRLRLAQSRISGGNFETAVPLLEEIISEESDNPQAYAMLIVGYIREASYDKARTIIDKVKASMPNSGLPYNFLAAIALAEDNRDAARGYLEQAVEVQADFFPALLNLARIDQAENDLAGAKKQYQRILDMQPGHLESLAALIEIARSEEKYSEAMDLTNRAQNENPDTPIPQIARIQILLDQDKMDMALTEGRALLSAFPKNARALEAYAKLQLTDNQVLGAIGTYEELSKLLPTSASVLVEIAKLHGSLSNHIDAANAYDRALAINPESVEALTGRIIAEENIYNETRAIEMAEKLRDDLDNALAARIAAGDAYFRAGQNEEALELYEDAYREEPTQRIVLQIHNSLSRLGRADDGLNYLRDWLNKNSDDDVARFVFSSALITKGDYDGAIQEAENILETSPDNSIVMNNLAWLYQQKGRDEEALELAEKAHEISPLSGEIADTLGWMLFQRGEKQRALKLLEEASKAAPKNDEIAYHYAAALHDSGDTEKAKEVLENGLTVNSNFSDVDKARALLEELSE